MWPFAWQRLLATMLVSLESKQSDRKEKLVWGNVGELTVVLCIVWGCGSKSGKHKGLGFFRIPKIITDNGEEYEKLTRKCREGWISAVSHGNTAEKNIIDTERVSGRHFHQGQFTPDWVPSLKLGKKEYRHPKDFKASVERWESWKETEGRHWPTSARSHKEEKTSRTKRWSHLWFRLWIWG